ncbi:MAG: MarR family transcriptional regulator [Desulfurococcales archaeon]|nr:MarR family transcriptional regulator [Desulfurococcales archaeon]
MSKQMSNLEKEALNLIKNSNGILQSELVKELGLDSREGSRLVLRLTKKGLIRREQVSVNGRRTYRLLPVESKPQKASIKINITTILDIPCTTCPYIDQCGPGNFYDPATCPLMDRWLEENANKISRLLRKMPLAE